MGRGWDSPDLGVVLGTPVAGRDLNGDAGELADVLQRFDEGGVDNDLITAAWAAEFAELEMG